MRYAYMDLGEQPAGATAIVRWGGSPATAMLFDPVNFAKYIDRLPWSCEAGGRCRHSPARLRIPKEGRWYAVLDLGGYASTRRPTVELVGAEDAEAATGSGDEAEEVGVNAAEKEVGVNAAEMAPATR